MMVSGVRVRLSVVANMMIIIYGACVTMHCTFEKLLYSLYRSLYLSLSISFYLFLSLTRSHSHTHTLTHSHTNEQSSISIIQFNATTLEKSQ